MNKFFTFVALICVVCPLAFAQTYRLVDNFSGNNFFPNFDFWTAGDPTHGYVTFVSEATAQSQGLINVTNGIVIVASDFTKVASGSGRESIRISSKKTYNYGLFILDLNHMPFGCGNWPAFWMCGPNWPSGGEIDIIEGVNNGNLNAMTLHTNQGCTMANVKRSMTGNATSPDCYVSDPHQSNNQGCGVHAPTTQSFGQGFNNNRGGVYATLWSTAGIDIWFFPRQSIPADVNSNTPNPNTWGTPTASFPFGGNCPTSHFHDQQIIFDNTFCGDWAGAVFNSMGCSGSCNDYVKNNPKDFQQAFWSINFLKTFEAN